MASCERGAGNRSVVGADRDARDIDGVGTGLKFGEGGAGVPCTWQPRRLYDPPATVHLRPVCQP
jgi:hypothetical protein